MSTALIEMSSRARSDGGATGLADSEGNCLWNVVVVLHRESMTQALQCLAAIHAAAHGPLVVDLIVNGRHALAEALNKVLPHELPLKSECTLRLWSIQVADKANAWNEYVHKLWAGNGPAFFVDGYVRVRRDALEQLAGQLARTPSALAAAAVPTQGRSASQLRAAMVQGGGLHGNLFVLSERALLGLRARAFRLPLGLYRVDAALGAALSFGLDPATQEWQPQSRISVVTDASWDAPRTFWWRWGDLKSAVRRRLRQAQGVLENQAVRNRFAVLRQPIGSLPATVFELVAQWKTDHAGEYRRLVLRRPSVAMAWRRLQRQRDRAWLPASLEPQLVGRWAGASHGGAGRSTDLPLAPVKA